MPMSVVCIVQRCPVVNKYGPRYKSEKRITCRGALIAFIESKTENRTHQNDEF